MNSWNVGKVRTYSCFELCPVHLELQNVNAKQDLKEQQLQNKTDMVPNSYKLYVGKVRTYSYLESCGAGKMSSTFRTGKTSMRNRTWRRNTFRIRRIWRQIAISSMSVKCGHTAMSSLVGRINMSSTFRTGKNVNAKEDLKAQHLQNRTDKLDVGKVRTYRRRLTTDERRCVSRLNAANNRGGE